MSIKYVLRNGARIAIDPNVVGTALETMAEQYGQLTPKLVVEESRPVDAPLHPVFEWDNLVAGELYREQQARHLMRSIKVVMDNGDERHCFVNVAQESADEPDIDPVRVYMPLSRAMLDEQLRKQVLATALAELRAFRKKYAELKELAKVFESIAQLEATIV